MDAKKLRYLLLQWFDQNGRELPWRFKGGAHPDPYVVLVSEIMLQQTTVKTVIPYFARFMNRFPTLKDLAEAPLEDVYLFWQGLGYYTRAKSLHQTAQIILKEYGGKFPFEKEKVSQLKGLGPYTIASFLALAFNQPETVVDGNVIRIMSRLLYLTDPIDEIRNQIDQEAKKITDPQNPADYASAIMDLGALICTPKAPKCLECPWQAYCLSKDKPNLEQIPQRRKISKKEFKGYVYLIENSQHEILIRLRSEKGLLSGLYEFPWSEEKLFDDALETSDSVSHIFTHINMNLKICYLSSEKVASDGFFVPKAELKNYPFSTLMQKVLRQFLKRKRS